MSLYFFNCVFVGGHNVILYFFNCVFVGGNDVILYLFNCVFVGGNYVHMSAGVSDGQQRALDPLVWSHRHRSCLVGMRGKSGQISLNH